MGYGQQPYRRGLFNTVMGINAPAAIQRRQYLTQVAGPTYADGTPVIGGALPEGTQLKNIDVIKRGMFERMFPGKDEEGNRIARGPKRSLRYNFSTQGSSTPSLDGGDNAISNFKINPVPSYSPSTPQPAGPVNDPSVEKRGLREKPAYIGNRDLGTEIGDRGSMMSSGKSMRDSRRANRQENRADRKSDRDFRRIGREAKTYL